MAPAFSRSVCRACFDLARAGNFPSVASNVLAALVLSSAPRASWPAGEMLVLAVLAGCLIYAGGATFNDVADAAIDARDRPERAIPRGVVSRPAAAGIAALELVAGVGLLIAAGASATRTTALLTTILAYDWVHKRWSGSVVLMAGCRVLLAFTLASLPGQSAGRFFGAWVTALFVYIVTLSLLARRENVRAHRARASLGTAAAESAEKSSSSTVKRGPSIARLLAFIPLVDAIALLLTGAWTSALVCAAAVPLGRWTQRLAAST